MVYTTRRTQQGRKRRYNNKRYYKGVSNDIKYLKTLVNSEYHHYEFNIGFSSISTSGTVASICDVGVGDLNNERTGSSILPRYLKFKGVLKQVNTAPCRMIIFRWKDNTSPTVGDVLHVIATSNAPYSFLNENVIGNVKDRKIVILYDRLFTPMSNSGTSSSGYRSLDINISMNSMRSNYKWHTKYINNDSSDVPIMNGLYMLAVSNTTVASAVTLDGIVRLSFIDN